MIPVALRILGKCDDLPIRMRANYAMALYQDPGASLDDLREAVTTLEENKRTAQRVLGGAHPSVAQLVSELNASRAVLRARETPPGTR